MGGWVSYLFTQALSFIRSYGWVGGWVGGLPVPWVGLSRLSRRTTCSWTRAARSSHLLALRMGNRALSFIHR